MKKKCFFLKYDVHGYRRYNGIQRISRLVLYLEPISVLELLDRRFTFVSVNSDPVCITPNLLDFGNVDLSTGFFVAYLWSTGCLVYKTGIVGIGSPTVMSKRSVRDW
jgi:hypothetical protein